MTVAELIEWLSGMPVDALVRVAIRTNVNYEDGLEELYEFREVPPEAVVYSRGRVLVQLDE